MICCRPRMPLMGVLFFLFSACNATSTSEYKSSDISPEESQAIETTEIPDSSGIAEDDNILTISQNELERDAWVESMISAMNLKQKLGQFFMVDLWPMQGEASITHAIQSIKNHHVGSIIVFKSHPHQMLDVINRSQEASTIPLLVAVDGEWGVDMRLDSVIEWPYQLALGSATDFDPLYQMGKAIAKECSRLGIHINFAPVVDVNSNPNNPVIGYRSFGENPYRVGQAGSAYMRGMQDHGIMAVAKHFPGHGDTDSDSHKTLPSVLHDRNRLNQMELPPFQQLIQDGVAGIMAAHLFVPNLDNRNQRPTSLSSYVLKDLLRDSLGFDGLVFSDALNMQGASGYGGAAEVAYQAFLAGNDILVMAQDIGGTVALLEEGIAQGEITMDEIHQRLRLILQKKYDAQLHQYQLTNTRNLINDLNPIESKNTVIDLYQANITWIPNADEHSSSLPLRDNQSIYTLALGSSSKQIWQDRVGDYIPSEYLTTQTFEKILPSLRSNDHLVIGIHNLGKTPPKFGMRDSDKALISKVSNRCKVTILLFGLPYALENIPNDVNVLMVGADRPEAQIAAVNAILGKHDVNGRLAISTGQWQEGQGEDLMGSGIPLGIPFKVGPDPVSLDLLKAYENKTINTRSAPGGVVMVNHHGRNIYSSAFGNHTYDEKRTVLVGDLFDLASITKVASTTLCVMKLVEDGKIDLDKTFAHYMPEFEESPCGGVRLRDALMHQSGLPAWIPFYVSSLDQRETVYSNHWQAGYSQKVADTMFIRDDVREAIWDTIAIQELTPEPTYKYSDLGFLLLGRLIERVTGEPLDAYVYNEFYFPMGLESMMFNPWQWIDRDHILPTEDDTLFRKQLLDGYVHDMAAAMLGGVAGHAGLFSNADDLASLFQMLLNGGTWQGRRYLSESTIDDFTRWQRYPGNNRGLGFHKPDRDFDGGPTSNNVSLETFGHTGFTGTSVWADPVANLIYIFLSNRCYPDAYNPNLVRQGIRTDLQTEIYETLFR